MKDGLVSNRSGNILLEFILSESNTTILKEFKPLTHSLLVVKCEGKYLLVYNKFRNHWEVPGGRLEPDESPMTCAIRELAEESGQPAENLKLEGIMKFRLQPDNRIEYGALYSVVLNKLASFYENQEISAIILWNKNDDIGYIDEIDKALLGMVKFSN